jgi:HK97 family phage major capsid protein
MPYNNSTDSGDVAKLIPEYYATEIFKNLPQQSAAMTLFKHINLSTRIFNQPVLSALPVAYFVNGDTGMKQTTEMAWANKVMTVEEIATIVPIPINVIEDTSLDMWAEIRPNLEEAIARTLDAAVFFGTAKPASWPVGIVPAAVAAGNYVDRVPGDTSVNLVDKISDVWVKVEASGYDVNGMIAPRALKGTFRKFRDTTGQRLMDFESNTYEGVTTRFPMDGLWPTGATPPGLYPQVVAGDFTRGILGVRKDITFELFREGVVTDNSTPPVIMFNLMQQDMVAMRVTARFAWQTANPINFNQATEANRYPFAVLRSSAT